MARDFGSDSHLVFSVFLLVLGTETHHTSTSNTFLGIEENFTILMSIVSSYTYCFASLWYHSNIIINREYSVAVLFMG